MNLYDSLPDAAPAVFGEEAVGSSSYDVLTVDVPVGSWISSLEIARDKLGCTYFDWLSAVDEPGTGFRICAHVVSLENHRVRRLLLRTTVPHAAPSLPSAVAVYAGAEWHERETFEMFGVVFTDHPHLVHLLLPENFEGNPLRKDFVLAARVTKAWPGAKEPGEAHDPDAPKRRQMLPPGVPDPNDWGPMKGQLPPAPARPARTPRAAGATGAAARTPREGAPARRTRSVADGSATQPADASATEAQPRPPRRTRSVADGSASQAAPAPETPATPTTPAVPEAPAGSEAPAAPESGAARPARRARSAADGSASQTTEAEAEADAGTGTPAPEAARRPAPRSADAPWHNPKPAFEEPPAKPDPAGPQADAPAPPPETSRPDTDTTPDTTGGDA
ncbi:NADH-quinone oxidoreductase subunit C [Streptomyces sp. NBC_00190]|uniref:NADH-quinone oxidoreductase subunit C n=1 Tax=unclassified Streptomyces TaxID=2593676 RepID=UPI002E2933C2|nr:NADH-quinone oxidoreductase subunit C [Streptomyces sp. NBC_00190]WSZ41835.1 NADH-quinone oxidoreductase subunit C [Streptomyces sp. NBC_00868]